MKIENAAQYLARYLKRGKRRAPVTRASDCQEVQNQPKWDGDARVDHSGWAPQGAGEPPVWMRRIGL